MNAKTPWGTTALMYAASDNAIDVARLLIESGADVNARNAEGKNALLHVKGVKGEDPSADNAKAMARLLIESGAE